MIPTHYGPDGPDGPNVERFVEFGSYETNLPTALGSVRVRVELLVDPDSIDGFWAVIPALGVAAAGDTPAAAALSAMRAGTAMLTADPLLAERTADHCVAVGAT